MNLHDKMIELSRKYNLPLTILLTSAAITDTIYKKLKKGKKLQIEEENDHTKDKEGSDVADKLEERVDTNKSEITEKSDEAKKLEDNKSEEKQKDPAQPNSCEKIENGHLNSSSKSGFNGEEKSFDLDKQSDLSDNNETLTVRSKTVVEDAFGFTHSEIVVIVHLACKIHNLPPLLPRVPDNDLHTRTETKFLKALDFDLMVPDVATIMCNITSDLMCTNEETIDYLKRLLFVHLDQRISAFYYFNKSQIPQDGHFYGKSPKDDSKTEQGNHLADKSPNHTSPDIKFDHMSLNVPENNINHDSSRLAYFPQFKFDENAKKYPKDQYQALELNAFDCCLALLNEDDLVRYEITQGENRPENVSQMRTFFSTDMPYISN